MERPILEHTYYPSVIEDQTTMSNYIEFTNIKGN